MGYTPPAQMDNRFLMNTLRRWWRDWYESSLPYSHHPLYYDRFRAMRDEAVKRGLEVDFIDWKAKQKRVVPVLGSIGDSENR